MSEGDEAYFHALRTDDPAQLYDRAPCGYLTTSSDGTIRKVNRTFLTLAGYDTDELIDVRRFSELLSVGGRIYYETHYAPLLHMSGVAREIAFDLVCRDGRLVPVLVNATVDRDPTGEVAAIRVAVFDASHRRAYERELLQAKQRAEHEAAKARALAQTLQQTLIPRLPPAVPNLDVAAEYRPAGDGTEVGGDFYDVFQVSDTDWIVVVGDVRGKGVEAAVVTALVRDTLRAATMLFASPAEALRRLNEVLLHYAVDRHCTVVLARLRQTGRSWQCMVSSGGHPLPILRRVDTTTRLVECPGTLLGMFTEPRLQDTMLRVEPGDLLLLYTDGVIEARSGDRFYGEPRLHALLGRDHASAQDLVAALLGEVLEFQQGVARDDIAMVAVRAHP